MPLWYTTLTYHPQQGFTSYTVFSHSCLAFSLAFSLSVLYP